MYRVPLAHSICTVTSVTKTNIIRCRFTSTFPWHNNVYIDHNNNGDVATSWEQAAMRSHRHKLQLEWMWRLCTLETLNV